MMDHIWPHKPGSRPWPLSWADVLVEDNVPGGKNRHNPVLSRHTLLAGRQSGDLLDGRRYPLSRFGARS